MLPKYLPPPYDRKFHASVQQQVEKEGLNATDAFRTVHDMINEYENKGMEPLEALDMTHSRIVLHAKP